MLTGMLLTGGDGGQQWQDEEEEEEFHSVFSSYIQPLTPIIFVFTNLTGSHSSHICLADYIHFMSLNPGSS